MKNNNLKKENWLKRSIDKYGDKFDYSHVKYKSSTTRVAIICKRHGLFMQTPNMHLSYGCKPCNSNRLSKEEFFEHVRKIHGDKYDYSKSVYNPFYPLSDMMIITCKIHGDFVQRIQSHQEGHGCPVCNGKNKKVIKNEFTSTNDNPKILNDSSYQKYNVHLLFNLGKNDVRVDVKADPFSTKNEADEFVKNIRLFTELIEADVPEVEIKENIIRLPQEQHLIPKRWFDISYFNKLKNKGLEAALHLLKKQAY